MVGRVVGIEKGFCMRQSRAVAYLTAVASSSCLVMSAALPASADTSQHHASDCQAERLATPAESDMSIVVASDPSGRWMTGTNTFDFHDHTVVWHNGAPKQLRLSEYTAATSGAINARGMVAGDALHDGQAVGFVYSHRSVVELARPEGMEYVTITGIDRRGNVSGWAMPGDSSTAAAYVWRADDPAHPSKLDVPDGFATAVGSSADGHIAVLVTGDDGGFRSFVFSRNLHPTELTGSAAGYQVAVSGIANGWVAGREVPTAGSGKKPHSVRWNLQTGELQIVPVAFSAAAAVNGSGVVGGETGTGINRKAVLYGDALTTLPSFGGAPDVAVVTDAGDAAGSAELAGAPVAVLWTCD